MVGKGGAEAAAPAHTASVLSLNTSSGSKSQEFFRLPAERFLRPAGDTESKAPP